MPGPGEFFRGLLSRLWRPVDLEIREDLPTRFVAALGHRQIVADGSARVLLVGKRMLAPFAELAEIEVRHCVAGTMQDFEWWEVRVARKAGGRKLIARLRSDVDASVLAARLAAL